MAGGTPFACPAATFARLSPLNQSSLCSSAQIIASRQSDDARQFVEALIERHDLAHAMPAHHGHVERIA